MKLFAFVIVCAQLSIFICLANDQRQQQLVGIGEFQSINGTNFSVLQNLDKYYARKQFRHEMEVTDLKTAFATVIKDEFMKKLRFRPLQWDFISYRLQDSTGYYFIKARIRTTEFVHLLVMKPFRHQASTMQLIGIERNKQLNDELLFFRPNLVTKPKPTNLGNVRYPNESTER